MTREDPGEYADEDRTGEEPRVLTPEEEAERSLRALAEGTALKETGQDPAQVADPRNPLRMPGESSPSKRRKANR